MRPQPEYGVRPSSARRKMRTPPTSREHVAAKRVKTLEEVWGDSLDCTTPGKYNISGEGGEGCTIFWFPRRGSELTVSSKLGWGAKELSDALKPDLHPVGPGIHPGYPAAVEGLR